VTRKIAERNCSNDPRTSLFARSYEQPVISAHSKRTSDHSFVPLSLSKTGAAIADGIPGGYPSVSECVLAPHDRGLRAVLQEARPQFGDASMMGEKNIETVILSNRWYLACQPEVQP
jgi:hypothetical protein